MKATWTLKVERLATELAVGIYESELEPQPIWVSLTATGEASAAPSELNECFDYEPLCRWITEQWPQSPHTPLLETRINQLIAFVFESDERIRHVWVGLYKQQFSQQALSIGMERDSTRAEYQSQRIRGVRKTAARSVRSEYRESHAESSI